ncbi:ulp1 protease family, C-terminal catalytic domain-containing protein [Tanacetum coccineum]
MNCLCSISYRIDGFNFAKLLGFGDVGGVMLSVDAEEYLLHPGYLVKASSLNLSEIATMKILFQLSKLLKLLKGHMKVSVIKVVKIHKSMELPVPDDEIPNLESALNWYWEGLSKTPVSGVPTKRVMPQHENAPSTKKGKGNETLKEHNKKDKALEETTKHQKTKQKIAEVKERVSL